MKRALLSLAGLLCTALCALAGSVAGTVVDKAGQPLPFANVIAYRGETLVRGTVSDSEGGFLLADLAAGDYTVSFQMMGYETLRRAVTVPAAGAARVDMGRVALAEEARQVGEVSVVAQKSTMKLDIDKKVFDVGQDIASTGGSASDVLENIPSVEVDAEGNISLRGSASVTVWINGKAQGMTSDNRGDILQQLPSESIERVEVITNPSSKYSAEGSAGIINIVLKRDRKAGYYGGAQLSVNSTGGGRAGANINYSSPLIDAYLNLGYGLRRHDNGGWTRRDYKDGDVSTGYLNSAYDGDRKGNNLFTRAGLTWHVSERDEISAGFMGMFGGGDNKTSYDYTSAPYAVASSPGADGYFDSFWRTRVNENEDDVRMSNFEVSYRHSWAADRFVEATGSKFGWRMDGDTYYDQGTYFDKDLPDGAASSPEALAAAATRAYQRQESHIKKDDISARLDYEGPVGDAGRLQAGYEGAFSREDSPTETFADEAKTQSIRSLFNRFKYDTDIHALYANWTQRPGDAFFGYQVGLRGEWWTVRTASLDYEMEYEAKAQDRFSRDYFGLFPTAYLSFKMGETQELQVNYTRRLQRPWGGQMNSFKNISDSTSISYGNPELTPEYSNSLELNYIKTWADHTLSFSAYFRPSTDVIQQIAYMDGGVRYSTNRNIARSQRSGLEVIGKNRLLGRLDLTTTLNVYYYTLDGGTFSVATDQGGRADVTVRSDEDFSWTLREMASLMLPREFTFQATFNYDSPTVISQGTRDANHYLDLGLRKQLLDRKLSLALNCRDILDSRAWRTTTSGEGFSQESRNWRGGRRFIVQVGWTFGNMAGKAAKVRRDGAVSPDGGYSGEGMSED